jgi:hypothetical protein
MFRRLVEQMGAESAIPVRIAPMTLSLSLAVAQLRMDERSPILLAPERTFPEAWLKLPLLTRPEVEQVRSSHALTAAVFAAALEAIFSRLDNNGGPPHPEPVIPVQLPLVPRLSFDNTSSIRA